MLAGSLICSCWRCIPCFLNGRPFLPMLLSILVDHETWPMLHPMRGAFRRRSKFRPRLCLNGRAFNQTMFHLGILAIAIKTSSHKTHATKASWWGNLKRHTFAAQVRQGQRRTWGLRMWIGTPDQHSQGQTNDLSMAMGIKSHNNIQ